MNKINSLLTEVDEHASVDIQSEINDFVAKWNKVDSLKKNIAEPTGTGVLEDLYALDYVIYEHLFDLFFDDLESFLHTGSLILGNYLVAKTNFEWKHIKLKNLSTLCLKHKSCTVVVPIVEMVLSKFSGKPQFDTFEALYFDILFSDWEVTYAYPLVYRNLNLSANDMSFREKFGYEIPQYTAELFFLYSLPDEESLIRNLGFEGLECCDRQDWQRLELIINMFDDQYKASYGTHWKRRFFNKSRDLFTSITTKKINV